MLRSRNGEVPARNQGTRRARRAELVETARQSLRSGRRRLNHGLRPTSSRSDEKTICFAGRRERGTMQPGLENHWFGDIGIAMKLELLDINERGDKDFDAL